ncbi:hypothetical protein X946_3682 [Burkholderia sp. ABCPW 111]|nr:hypothetical protein X946_3682 [Burkholderia sp. ABCPW 111]
MHAQAGSIQSVIKCMAYYLWNGLKCLPQHRRYVDIAKPQVIGGMGKALTSKITNNDPCAFHLLGIGKLLDDGRQYLGQRPTVFALIVLYSNIAISAFPDRLQRRRYAAATQSEKLKQQSRIDRGHAGNCLHIHC